MKYENFSKLNILSLSFLLVYTSYLSGQNAFINLVQDNETYGLSDQYYMGISYLTFGIFSVLATSIINKINCLRLTIFFGCITSTIVVLSYIIFDMFYNLEKSEKEKKWYLND